MAQILAYVLVQLMFPIVVLSIPVSLPNGQLGANLDTPAVLGVAEAESVSNSGNSHNTAGIVLEENSAIIDPVLQQDISDGDQWRPARKTAGPPNPSKLNVSQSISAENPDIQSLLEVYKAVGATREEMENVKIEAFEATQSFGHILSAVKAMLLQGGINLTSSMIASLKDAIRLGKTAPQKGVGAMSPSSSPGLIMGLLGLIQGLSNNPGNSQMQMQAPPASTTPQKTQTPAAPPRPK